MLKKIAKACKIGNKIVDKIISILVIFMFLIGGLGIYDAIKIYSGAKIPSNIAKFQPKITNGQLVERPDLNTLITQYPDTKAWVVLNDTSINYPVVQGKDNMEYINKTIEGKYALSGSIFLDSSNDSVFTDDYSLLYGHHMDADMMFGGLPKFKETEYFNSHTSGFLITPRKTMNIEIFACVLSVSYDKTIFRPSRVRGEKSVQNMLSYIKSNAVQYRDANLTSGDTIIGLSTCYSSESDGRCIVYGILKEAKNDG